MGRLLGAGVAGVLALVLFLSSTAGQAQAVWSPFQSLAGEVYFQQTGHHVSDPFLTYWWNNGGLDVFGFPVSEQMKIDGRQVQYFERARFEYHPENDANHQVLLGLLGHRLTAGRTEPAFDPYPADFAFSPTSDRDFFPATGHFLGYGFRSFWRDNGGLAIFGYPISEEFSENGHTVQYFERARFEYHPEHAGTRYEVQLGLLGSTIAQRDGVNLEPVAQKAGVPVWPGGVGNPSRWIEINLSQPQLLTAWEGDTAVFQTYVSGGLATTPTPTGTFQVFWKLRYDDMTGGQAGSADYYYLPNVPWVMYFAEGGYAIHGTYWHANYGYPMSHGCVNVSQAGAEWLYNWAPYGTPIWIHY